MAETRKLAAILAADIVGYSKLAVPTKSGRSRGCARREDLIDPTIACIKGE